MNEEFPTPDNSPTPVAEPLYLLCVDDEVDILKSLARLFRKESFKVLTASSGQDALNILGSTKNIGLILSDQRMPEMNGADFLAAAKEVAPDAIRMILTGYSDIAAAISAINQGGAKQFLNKPWNDAELLRVVRDGLQQYLLVRENQQLHETVREQNQILEEWNGNLKRRVIQQTALIRSRLEESNLQRIRLQYTSDTLLHMFIDTLEQSSHQLSIHSKNVMALTESMLAALSLTPPHCETIRTAALLHDIGLFSAADHLFEGSVPRVGTNEFRDHCVKGEELLATSAQHKGIGLLIRHHHEAFDGSGFPDGLSGEQIPLGSRIINLASFIDNVYSVDSGKETEYQINCQVAAGMGTLFDPALAHAASRAVKEMLENQYY